MKPNRMHYFFAQNWPFRIWMGSFLVISVVGAVRFSEPSLALLLYWWYWPFLLGVICVSLLLGWFSGLLIGWPVLGTILCAREFKHGAPFHEGDRVRILTGIHKERVVRVYDVWAEGGQIRVELGDKEREEFTDVFDFTQVVKEHDAEQSCGETTSNSAPGPESQAKELGQFPVKRISFVVRFSAVAGIVLFWLPIAGLVFSLIGLLGSLRSGGWPKKVSIVGTVLAAIATIIAIIVL